MPTRRQELPYEEVRHHCSTDDQLFIAGDQSTGVVDLEHDMISTKKLNSSQFFSLYTSVFANDNTPGGEEEHVTSWRCGTRNVRNASLPMRAVLCLRRYRKLGELYDGVLKVAVLGRNDSGLVSTLTMSGVTFENVDRLARRYLERILMAMILEVVHPSGTRTWHRLGDRPVTLGRGLANDLILDDPYVDARHARIAVDEFRRTADRGPGERERIGGERCEAVGRRSRASRNGDSRWTHDASLP